MSVYQRPLRSDELMHFGVKGMKWGQRRYQNEDGTLTSAGKQRYGMGEGKRKKGMSTAKKIAIGAGVAAGMAGAGALGYAAYKNKKIRKMAAAGYNSMRPKPTGISGAARAALPGGKSLPAVRGRQGKTAMAYMNDIAKRKGDFRLYNKVGKKAKSGLPSVVNSRGSSLATRGGSATRNGYWQPGLKRVTRDLRPLEAALIGGAAAGAGAAGYAAYRRHKKKSGSKKGGRR